MSWVIKCITDEDRGEIGYFDFTFVRNFEWKQTKEPYGYKCVFKNKRDYDTALDMTMFNENYKYNMKWIYES